MNPDDKVSPKTIFGKPFSQMTFGEKALHIGKVIVFVITAGFAFPTIFTD